MGYTHYWYRPEELAQDRYRLLAADIRSMLSRLPEHSTSAGSYYADSPLIIRGANGKGMPEITDTWIAFNGNDEQGQHLGHETMFFPRIYIPEAWEGPYAEQGMYFQFCKTARKPYDLLVCATLLAAKFHFPMIGVYIDGDSQDWAASVAWYRSCFTDRPLKSGPWNDDL
jgi:hypothetical protein